MAASTVAAKAPATVGKGGGKSSSSAASAASGGYTGGQAYGISPDQLRAMVASEVSAQLAPQQSALRQAQSTTDTQYAQREQAVRNLTGDYANLLTGIGPQVSSVYDNAANSIADYGKGFSGTIQDALNSGTAADRSLLGVAGSTPGQVAAVAGHTTAPTDALYGMHGALPATALQTSGAALTAAADQLPAEAVGRGQMTDATLVGANSLADQTYRQDLAKILASVPTLRTNAENNILKNARSDMVTNLALNKFGLSYGKATGLDPVTHAAIATPAQIAATKAHQTAIAKRDSATRSLLTKMSNWVYKQRHTQGNIVIGHEPIKQTVSTPNGSITQFFVNGKWVPAASPPPNAATKPVYAKGDVPANYHSMSVFLTRTLTQGLLGFGYKPADIQQMVSQLLGPPPAPAAPVAPAPAPTFATHPRP